MGNTAVIFIGVGGRKKMNSFVLEVCQVIKFVTYSSIAAFVLSELWLQTMLTALKLYS